MTPLACHDIQTILCLGCHADDIEIGCGGTVLKLLDQHPHASVTWAVLSAAGPRADEAKNSAEAFLSDVKNRNIIISDFSDRYFPTQYEAIKNHVHKLAEEFRPDIVLTHRREDEHQDHRLAAELSWNAFRDHLILEYEIPKYEGDLGQPNFFVPLADEVCTQKVDTIFSEFVSQRDKPWFTKDVFWSLLRLRGLECNSASGYAEGLYCRKLTLN